MSTIKKVVRRVVTKSSSLSSFTKSSPRDSNFRSSLSNGRPSTNTSTPTDSDLSANEAPPQIVIHNDTPRTSRLRARNLSFSEQRAERREERETKDDAECQARKLRQKELHLQVPLARVTAPNSADDTFHRTLSGKIMATCQSICQQNIDVIHSTFPDFFLPLAHLPL